MPEGRPLAAEREAMYLTLTDDIKSFAREMVATGAFPSKEAVVLEAVRRFREEDERIGYTQRRKQARFDDLIDYEAIAS